MKLTTSTLIGIAIAIAIAIPGSAQGLQSIAGSAHDFTGDFGSTDICSPCHVPHNAGGDPAAPLWNHAVTTSTFTPYPSGGTMQATTSGTLTGVTLLCMSCHDGVVALDSYMGEPAGSTLISSVDPAAEVGIDLSDDHPINFTYDSALAGSDGALVDPSADGDANPNTVGLAQPYLELFSGVLECATCHDVHNNVPATNTALLRVNNAGSALCLKCHEK